MDHTKRRQDVAGALILIGGVFVILAALDRLGTPAVRALGESERLIMFGLLIVGAAMMTLGAFELGGRPLLPSVFPSVLVAIGGVLVVIDLLRILDDYFTWWGEKPLDVVPHSSFWFSFFGALISGGGASLLL